MRFFKLDASSVLGRGKRGACKQGSCQDWNPEKFHDDGAQTIKKFSVLIWRLRSNAKSSSVREQSIGNRYRDLSRSDEIEASGICAIEANRVRRWACIVCAEPSPNRSDFVSRFGLAAVGDRKPDFIAIV